MIRLYLWLVGLAMLVGLLYGTYKYIDTNWETSAGIEKGESTVREEWKNANIIAKAEEELQAEKREAEAEKVIQAKAISDRKATESDFKWRKEREKNKVLGTVTCDSKAPTAITISNLRLSYEFVSAWDGAWTNQKGEPVFSYPEGSVSEAARTVTIEEILSNHGENAIKCSGNSRQMNKLIDLLESLRN